MFKDQPKRKQRTREHIIADLSVNHVERHALQCGYSIEIPVHDYGIDLLLFTYNETGEIENGHVSFQLKATDNLQTLASGAIVFCLDRRDLDLWLEEVYPVILVVYDAGQDRAYWLYVQAELRGKALPEENKTVTVHIPQTNILDVAAIRQIAGYKQQILSKVQGTVRHEF
jgi:hypothetical protein